MKKVKYDGKLNLINQGICLGYFMTLSQTLEGPKG